jgi:hypothetical protein
MPGNVFQEYGPQGNDRFRYTTRGLSGTRFLVDDKISGVSKHRFSFMMTSGTFLVLFGTILHLKRHGIIMSHGSHLSWSTHPLAQYEVYSLFVMHNTMSSPATSHIYSQFPNLFKLNILGKA